MYLAGEIVQDFKHLQTKSCNMDFICMAIFHPHLLSIGWCFPEGRLGELPFTTQILCFFSTSVCISALTAPLIWGSNLESQRHSVLFLFVCFFGCVHSMQKFWGQGSNPYHSSNQIHSSGNARPLTCWDTRELPGLFSSSSFFFFCLFFCYFLGRSCGIWRFPG